MGKAAAALVSRELIAAGLPAATPALIVENASLPNERQVRTRLDLLALAAGAAVTDGPAILLIGQAVGATALNCYRARAGAPELVQAAAVRP